MLLEVIDRRVDRELVGADRRLAPLGISEANSSDIDLGAEKARSKVRGARTPSGRATHEPPSSWGRRADAVDRWPTPVEDILAASKLEVVRDSSFPLEGGAASRAGASATRCAPA